MSCEYCIEGNTYMMTTEIIEKSVFIMAEQSTFIGKEVLKFEDDIFVFLDRGYLRLAGSDHACMDHGEKMKINFCPVCGEWLTNPDKVTK